MPQRSLLTSALLTSLTSTVAFTVACASQSPDGNPIDAAPSADAAPAPRFGEAQIRFVVTEAQQSDGERWVEGANITGAAYENEPPIYHTEVLREGACRMLRYEAPTCTPFCDGVCRDGNICDPFPTFESVGVASVSGLKDGGALDEFDGRYFDMARIADDVFDDGDAIELTVSGAGGVEAFSLAAEGVSKLEASVDFAVTIEDGRDNQIEWQVGRGGDRARLILNSTNDAHGLPLNLIIECDAPDTGVMTIPQAMVEALPSSDGSAICVSVDCPASELWRYRVAETTVSGRQAELIVRSAIAFQLIHNP